MSYLSGENTPTGRPGPQTDPAMGQAPLTSAEQRVLAPVDPWSDGLACKIVTQDFAAAERYRNMNHDWRWRVADELYLAWVAQKYWEGTKIPRSSIPVYLVFQQVESMEAKIMSAIFSDDPWFEEDPGMGVHAAMARQFRDRISDQLDEANVREVVRKAVKSALIYGAGITALSWCNEVRDEIRSASEWDYSRGKPRLVLRTKKSKKYINKPELDYVSIKDFYVDPNTQAPSCQDPTCGYVIQRSLKPIQWLDSLRGDKAFNIPSREEMQAMTFQRPSAQSDTTKSVVELMRFGYWAPQIDQTSDPAGKRLELLVRTSRERVVWVLNRSVVIYNKPNPYGFINYYNAFYADVPDRFYGLSLSDVLEGEQRFRTSLINARVDELALSIHAPVQYKRGLNIPSYQLRTRPGQMIQVEEPGKDYIRTEMGGITQNAYIEDQAAEARSQKVTGLSDLISTGVPTSGGNAAARTATGVGAQVQASGSRIQGVLETLESTYIEPLLNGVVALNLLYPPIGTPASQIEQLQNIKLYSRASARMKSQTALMQTFPLFMQAVLNPGMLEQLMNQGLTVNFNELMQMLMDMTGYKKRADLIVPVPPQVVQQHQQAQQQAQQADAQLKMQMQRERLQAQGQQTNVKLRAQMALEQMKQSTAAQLEKMRQQGGMAQSILPILAGTGSEGE